MKINILIIFSLLFIVGLNRLHSQHFENIRQHLDQINEQVNSNKRFIVTNQAANIYFAEKAAKYLSGSDDLSLFKNYAAFDNSDKRLFIGQNYSCKNSTGRISDLITYGFKTNIKDNFSSIVSNKKIQNDIGINIKYTHIFRGSIYFDKSVQVEEKTALLKEQKGNMNLKRKAMISKLSYQMEKDSAEFEESVKILNDSSYKNKLRGKFYKSRNKNYYAKEFAKLQAAEVENETNVNLTTFSWISIEEFIPLTQTEYSLTDLSSLLLDTVQFMPWDFKVSFNKLWDHKKYGVFFLSLGSRIFQNNSINSNQMTKVSLNQNTGTIVNNTTIQTSSTEVFLGDYDDFFSASLFGQLVYYPKATKPFGIRLSFEQNFGKYDPLNAILGFPITFKGKEKPVNIELQLKAFDITDEVKPNKSFSEKLVWGINVGLPFGSIIY